MIRAGDPHLDSPVLAGVLVVDTSEHDPMNLANVKRCDRLAAGRERLYALDGLLVVDDLEVLAQALADDGQSGFEDELSLTQRQRVTLDRVGMVCPPRLLPYAVPCAPAADQSAPTAPRAASAALRVPPQAHRLRSRNATAHHLHL